MEVAIRNVILQAMNEMREEGDRHITGTTFADRLFAKLFPNSTIVSNYEADYSESEVETKQEEIKVVEVKTTTTEEVKEKKKRAPPKPKLDENGNPIPKKSRVKKVAEEQPVIDNSTEEVKTEVKTDTDGESVSSKTEDKPAEKKKRAPPKPKLDENGNPIPKKPRTKKEKAPETAPVAEVKAEKPVETVEQESIEVEFEGQVYYVTPNDKKVWKEEGEAHVLVGYVGMAGFANLVVPE